jgi:hypothetical protein
MQKNNDLNHDTQLIVNIVRNYKINNEIIILYHFW